MQRRRNGKTGSLITGTFSSSLTRYGFAWIRIAFYIRISLIFGVSRPHFLNYFRQSFQTVGTTRKTPNTPP